MPMLDFPPLLWWGLPLVAAPVLIHLINLLRYRRVRWAAMEFLLASQTKYRTRTMLRQLLLLALRTAAIAGLVLALAQPRWRSAFGGFLGGGGRHLVLLDDSYSMGDLSRGEGGGNRGESAFDRGRSVVERIANDLANAGGRDELSLALFSALAAGTDGPALLLEPGPIGAGDLPRVRDAVARARPSWTACGPVEPLGVATELTNGGTASRTVWIVSDFRSRDWAPDETASAVRRLAESGWMIRLVDCGREPPAAGNLAVTRLEAVGGVPAAGVIVPVEVEVRNDGTAAARDVMVELREDGSARAGLQLSGIPPGGTATTRFDVRFAEPGGHVVEVRLPEDILPADDVATCAVEVAPAVDVLLVCDDPVDSLRRGDALYVSAALAPGSGAPTGLRPRVEPATALAALDLEAFDVIWILDPERLDARGIAALERHVRSGGGAVFFCGPRTTAAEVNRTLHRDGDGLFPVPLAGPVEVLPASGPEPVPDVAVTDHPVVAVLAGQRNPLLDAVRIDRVLAVDRSFDESRSPGLRRLLSLRTGGPLVVERPYGQGLVVAVLTTAAPEWNTWARGNPSWVVVMLELQNHLARQRRRPGGLRVGDRFTVPLVPGVDETEVDFLVPPDAAVIRQSAAASGGEGLEASLVMPRPGVCTARWRRVDGTERERVTSVSLDPAEGHLGRIGRSTLEKTLAGLPVRYDSADSLEPAGDAVAGMPLARPVLLGLLAILLLEQFVAWKASYHPQSATRRVA